jgi:hypothetical protein
MAQEGRDENGKFTEKNLFYLLRTNIGRTPHFKTPHEMAEKAILYFEWSNKYDKGKYTYGGIRLFCNITRSTLSDYRKKPDFSDTIEHIETVLEDYYEKKLGWAGSTQGAIFWLKNKAGWKDEITQNQNQTVTTVQPSIISGSPKLANDEKQIDI